MIAAGASPSWLPLILAPAALLAWCGFFAAVIWLDSRISRLFARVEATTATVPVAPAEEPTAPQRSQTLNLPRNAHDQGYENTAFNGFDGWSELAHQPDNPRGWLPSNNEASLIEGCDFAECTFAEPLSGVRFACCTFKNCKFHTELRATEFAKCSFTDCQLSWSTFLSCKLKLSEFANCTFTASVFMRCDLHRTVFSEPSSTFRETRFALVSITRATFAATSGIDGDSFSAQTADTSLVPGSDVPELNDRDARLRRNSALAQVQRAPALIQEDLAEYHDMLVHTKPLTSGLYPTLNQRLTEAGEVWRMLSGLFTERGEFAAAARAYVRAKRLERRDANPLRKRFVLPPEQNLHPPPSPHGGPAWPFVRTPTRLWSRLWRYLWLLLADALCGFGNAWGRILFWLAGLSALLAGLLAVFHALLRPKTIPGKSAPTADFLEAWEFAVGQLATSPAHEFKVRSIGWEVAASVETLAGVALVGLLGFVIANRLRFA